MSASLCWVGQERPVRVAQGNARNNGFRHAVVVHRTTHLDNKDRQAEYIAELGAQQVQANEAASSLQWNQPPQAVFDRGVSDLCDASICRLRASEPDLVREFFAEVVGNRPPLAIVTQEDLAPHSQTPPFTRMPHGV